MPNDSKHDEIGRTAKRTWLRGAVLRSDGVGEATGLKLPKDSCAAEETFALGRPRPRPHACPQPRPRAAAQQRLGALHEAEGFGVQRAGRRLPPAACRPRLPGRSTETMWSFFWAGRRDSQ